MLLSPPCDGKKPQKTVRYAKQALEGTVKYRAALDINDLIYINGSEKNILEIG